MKFENTEVWGFGHAIRGMRNPKESWDKSDSSASSLYKDFFLGDNDLKLAQTLIKAGSEHRKFMRQILIQSEVEATIPEWLKMENKFIEKSDLPDNFESLKKIRRRISMNYEVAFVTKHKYGKDYDEWLKTLPYAYELIFVGEVK